MHKRTLPPIAAPGALYVLAIAIGVLLSKPVAAVLAVFATVVLVLVIAGYERVQRHLPDLGRLPLVVDHGLHTKAEKARPVRVAVPQTPRQLMPHEAKGMTPDRERAVVAKAERKLAKESQVRAASQAIAAKRPETERHIHDAPMVPAAGVSKANAERSTAVLALIVDLREDAKAGRALLQAIDRPQYTMSAAEGWRLTHGQTEQEVRTWARRVRDRLAGADYVARFDEGPDLPAPSPFMAAGLGGSANKDTLVAFLTHKIRNLDRIIAHLEPPTLGA